MTKETLTKNKIANYKFIRDNMKIDISLNEALFKY